MGATALPKATLNHIHLLIADSDHRMADALAQMLQSLGFGRTRWAKDGSRALKMLQKNPADIVITDWHMKPLDGISLIQTIRRGTASIDRTLPIIMLTARGERQDVEAARDVGINEFVVKPYTAKTVFQRIRQVIDYPRSFVLSPTYVGPERRRKKTAPLKNDRRCKQPDIVPPSAILHTPYSLAVFPPANPIKEKLNLTDSIITLITPKMLEEAQESIDRLKDASLQWLKEELEVMERAFAQLAVRANTDSINSLIDSLLIIKGRAGTFGLPHLSQAAQLLYKFLRMDYASDNQQHQTVIEMHIRAITVIFAQSAKGANFDTCEELVDELQMLARKYEAA